MKEHDKIKELFSKKLGNYSAPVNPELWNAIAAKVAVGSTVATTGTSLLVKSIIGISAASIIGVTAYFVSQEDVVPTEQVIELNPTITAEQDVEKSNEKIPSVVQQSSNQESNSNSEKVDNSRVLENTSKGKETNKERAPIVVIEETVSSYVPKERKTPIGSETVDKMNTVSEEEEIVQKDSKKVVKNTDLKVKDLVVKQPNYLAEITLLPNSFTPNGDRVNDEFYIEFTGDLIDFNIVILDKQNRTIFESKDPNFRWNGMNRSGEFAPSGNYYYIVTANDRNGNPINQYNTLSIER